MKEINDLTISGLKKQLEKIYPPEQYIIRLDGTEGFMVMRKTNKEISIFYFINQGFSLLEDGLWESYYYIQKVPKQKKSY